jgi:mxaJ protein
MMRRAVHPSGQLVARPSVRPFTRLALLLVAAVPGLIAACTAAPEERVLRVCADPNNLPFTNDRGEGFENRIADVIATDLGARVEYTWHAQRRGFIRETLRAEECDVLAGVPTSFDLALTTRPYYRSSYVFVYRDDSGLDVRSFDDPRLRTLKVGVQVIGDDYANAPPAHALGNRGIIDNVVGFSVYGDYSHDAPPAWIMDAVVDGRVDLAVVWGPLAGWYAQRHALPVRLVPVEPQIDLPFLPFVFDIGMGVRHGETELREELDGALERRTAEINEILAEYGVPVLGRAVAVRGRGPT